jgi:PIN domain nuclease of toxin-antitoxin system
MGFRIMIVLDTHAWIWYVTESDKLSSNAYKYIEETDICGISAISCWEVAMLEQKKRLELNLPLEIWMDLALKNNKVKLLPLTPEISIKSSKLGLQFHGDPADRIITATAIHHNSILISKDSKIIESNICPTIW